MWQTRYLLTLVCVGALTTSASRADNTGPQQGELAPAFTIDAMLDASRKPPTLESLRGKPIVLEFWATWCPLCVADIPRLNGFVEDFKDKITFISVTDEKVDVVKPFLETHPLKPLIALDQDRSMLDGYKVTSVPPACSSARTAP